VAWGRPDHGSQAPAWARETLSRLSIIIVFTPHREHFSVTLKFTAADKI
jgi:hypothetical protein